MSSGAFSCDICKVTLNCYQQYTQHRAGKKHLNKVKQKNVEIVEPASSNQETIYGGSFVAASLSQAESLIEGTNTASTLAVTDPVKEAVVQNMLGTLPTKRKATVTGECVPCGVVFNSSEQEQMHLNGKKHAKKMKMTTDDTDASEPVVGECTPCGAVFHTKEQEEMHMNSKRHAKKTDTTPKEETEVRECKQCGLIFNSSDQEQMHLNGKKHAKRVQSAALVSCKPGTFFCSFCNVHVNSLEQLEQHRGGTQHLKKVGTAKENQDEARMESRLPKLSASFTPATSVEPPPLPPGGIPLFPAALESMKAGRTETSV